MQVLENLKNAYCNKPSIIMIGKFDGLHLGHQKLLNKLTSISKVQNLTSIVLSIDFPDNLHLLDKDEKNQILEQFNINIHILSPFDDYLKNIDKETFLDNILLQNLNVKAIVVGKDFSFGKNKSGNIKYLIDNETKGYKTYVEDYVYDNNQKISTSLIKELLNEGNVSQANKLLGYNYSFNGTVVKGNQIGKEIGIPTINLNPDKLKFVPKFGVYRSVLNDKYKGISNIGVKPTIKDNNVFNIEMHVFDFNKDLYNKDIKISLLEFVRDEVKFNSLNELQNQIIKDMKVLKGEKYDD